MEVAVSKVIANKARLEAGEKPNQAIKTMNHASTARVLTMEDVACGQKEEEAKIAEVQRKEFAKCQRGKRGAGRGRGHGRGRGGSRS